MRIEQRTDERTDRRQGHWNNQNHERGNACTSCRTGTRPHYRCPSRAHLPDEQLRLQKHGPRRQTSSPSKNSANIYTRLMNPTNDVVEKRIAALEGGTGGLLTSAEWPQFFLSIHNIAGTEITSSVPPRSTEAPIALPLHVPGWASMSRLSTRSRPGKSPRRSSPTQAVFHRVHRDPKGDIPDIAGLAKQRTPRGYL